MSATISPPAPGQHTTDVDVAEELPRLAVVLAEFSTVGAVLSAAKMLRAAGWTKWDVHSPFPIHGIDDVIGIRRTRLPWITLVAGATGIVVALLMQWWMNAVDYPFWISGKPFFGLPAAIPVAFELMILFAAISTLVGMLLLNGLPRFADPIFDSSAFLRATSDRFVISISADDPQFDEAALTALLTPFHPTAIDQCFAPERGQRRWPMALRAALLVLVVIALVPPALIAKTQFTNSREPRIQVIQDMDFQPKFKSQRTSTLFADGRAMRPQPAGTISRGDLRADPALYKGLRSDSGDAFSAEAASGSGTEAQQPAAAGANGAAVPPADPLDKLPWVTTFPIPITPTSMARGQERFNIYCAACHGLAGEGDGLVTRRALDLQQGTWVKPTSFHSDNLRAMPVGRLFHTVTNGARKMPGYADLIPVEDRWAILLYVRALQQSRHADVTDIPAELVPQLRDLPQE